MTVGVSTATANSILNVHRGTSFAGYANEYIQLHTGDPGAAGTANVSAMTTRNAITWNAASGGSMTLATLSSFTMTATETITHVSRWSASTSGTFIESHALTASVPVINGSVIAFSTFTLSVSPIAA
jgi:hypothetical protein